MTKFSEGQDVEVSQLLRHTFRWRKATIVGIEMRQAHNPEPTGNYMVEFIDGTRAMFDTDQIRAIEKERNGFVDEAPEAYIDE